jgi:bifunctional non-homologous end joining protein LigD
MWDFVLQHDLEGVLAKNPESRYIAGRTREWIKVKATQTLTCLVGGVEWAPDMAGEPRSLRLYLVDADGELSPVGKASAGVSPALRPALLHGLSSPPLIVEVEYTQITPAGVLRNPVIRAVRRDVDVLDCSTSQLA